MSLLGALMGGAGGGGGGGYPSPPNAIDQALGGMSRNDGADLFRLMSKANRYSQSSGRRKQQKGDKYAYMAGQMLDQAGVQSPQYKMYQDAYKHGSQHGMNPSMLGDFRSGDMTKKRQDRRKNHGRYDNRPSGQEKTGRKNEGGSMFDFFDSDTSSSSEDENQ